MIDPLITSTARVGELPEAPFNLTDNMPHEVGELLTRGTIQQLADLIGGYLGTTDSLAFNPTTVSDGGTLPETTSNEWMLIGKGTFHNVGGQPDIVTTEELNAVTSNSSFWSLSVQIPINFEYTGITQNIRSGYTETTPSEDAVFNRIAEIIAMIPVGLQSAYDSSSSPQITTNAALGAVTVKRGSASDGDVILQGQNGAGTTTFSVKGNGIATGQDGVNPLDLVTKQQLDNVNIFTKQNALPGLSGVNIFYGDSPNTARDARFYINKPIDLSGAGGHGIAEYVTVSQTTPSPTSAYASFDSRTEMIGANPYDHLFGFQSRNVYSGSGGLTGRMAAFEATIIHNGTGVIAEADGVHINTKQGSGPINILRGLYISDVTTGLTDNYTIYAGIGKVRFGGLVTSTGNFETSSNMKALDYTSLGTGKGLKLFDDTGDYKIFFGSASTEGRFGETTSDFNTYFKMTGVNRGFVFKGNSANVATIDYLGKGWFGNLNVTGLTASRAVVSDASKNLASSATTSAQIGYLSTATSDIQTQINAKSPLASPAFTGMPLAPTAAAGTNTTQIATTAFVATADAGNVKLTGDQTITGKKNFTSALDDYTTVINSTGSTTNAGGLFVSQSGGKTAVHATSTSGAGVFGGSTSGNGIGANSSSGIGLVSSTDTGTAIQALSSFGQSGTAYEVKTQVLSGGTFDTLFSVNRLGAVTASKYNLATGPNASAGNATLIAGTVTVSTTAATANSIIMLTKKTSGGTVGTSTYTAANGSFTITSSSGTDTSTYSYLIMN